MLSIGELSRRTGVRVPTIRYYEEAGLMPPPPRTGGNQRRYGEAAAERLGFIRHARDLGFSIRAIAALLALGGDPAKPCAEASRIAREQLAEVRDRIDRLRRLEIELDRIASGCDDADSGRCYVLRALSDHGLCGGEH